MPRLPDDARELSTDQIKQMTKLDLLEAIWSFEATYKDEKVDHLHDHRRYLQRSELETIFHLVRRRAELKAEASKRPFKAGLEQPAFAVLAVPATDHP